MYFRGYTLYEIQAPRIWKKAKRGSIRGEVFEVIWLDPKGHVWGKTIRGK